jgi:hypothetical protein
MIWPGKNDIKDAGIRARGPNRYPAGWIVVLGHGRVNCDLRPVRLKTFLSETAMVW